MLSDLSAQYKSNVSEISKIFLASVNSTTNCVWPTTISRQLCDTPISIWHFHKNHLVPYYN